MKLHLQRASRILLRKFSVMQNFNMPVVDDMHHWTRGQLDFCRDFIIGFALLSLFLTTIPLRIPLSFTKNDSSFDFSTRVATRVVTINKVGLHARHSASSELDSLNSFSLLGCRI